MTEPAALLERLGEPDTLAAVEVEWSESLAADLPVEFLAAPVVREHAEWVGLGEDVTGALLDTAGRVREHRDLRRLAQHAHWLLFHRDDYNRWQEWPQLESALGEQRGLFFLLLCLAGLPRLRERNAQRGIPEAVTRATARDFRIASGRYRRIHGRPGLEHWILNWFRLVTSGDLHRLGRVQYVQRPFRGRIVVFRHRHTHETLALAENGAWFTADGFLDRRGPEAPAEGSWEARLEEGPHEVVGVPVVARGVALREERRLSRADWRPVLRRDDPVLEIHIPEGDPYTVESWGDSFAQAAEFFPKHFPDRPFRAFACYSWLLGPDLIEILGPDERLTAPLREFYLFPIPSGGRDGLYFVFGRSDIESATAPRDTRLRRGILERFDRGLPYRGGGMFFLPEDLPRFGAACYQTASEQ